MWNNIIIVNKKQWWIEEDEKEKKRKRSDILRWLEAIIHLRKPCRSLWAATILIELDWGRHHRQTVRPTSSNRSDGDGMKNDRPKENEKRKYKRFSQFPSWNYTPEKLFAVHLVICVLDYFTLRVPPPLLLSLSYNNIPFALDTVFILHFLWIV